MVPVGGERERESGSDECVEKWRRGIATTAQNGVCRGGDAATRHTGYAESYISARLQSEVFEVSEVALGVPRNDIRPRAKTKTGPNLEA
jgi:hypothetical protein